MLRPTPIDLLFISAMICETGNHGLVNGFVLHVESELFRDFLVIKLFVATVMEISKNTLKRDIESDIFYKSSGEVSQYILRSGNLWHPLSRSMPENKQNVSLEISRLRSAFSL